ncbi:hypothetical protein TNCV_204011 [Trichonephila clavipes]|nr:hypothetical protein TNCV_204011 [Trichonephila clavipes]
MRKISSRYHVPKARPSKRKIQSLLKSKKRWASGLLELEHPSFHDNDPNASGHASSNYEKNAKVNTWTLHSSELSAATERKMSLLSTHFCRRLVPRSPTGLELFALVTGMNAMDKKSFSQHIKFCRRK